MNCDGPVNLQDVDPFIQALFDPADYVHDHTGGRAPCDIRNGDFNADNTVNGQDIDGFVTTVLHW